MESFNDYCKKNMSSYDFENLHNVAKVSKTLVTRMLKKPDNMNFAVLVAVAKALDKKPLELINNHNCALDGITVREYLLLHKPPYST